MIQMPRISSFNYKGLYAARDRHKLDPTGDEKREKIYDFCRNCVINRIRDISYKDMAEGTGLELGQVKYHFDKLRRTGAISTYEDNFKEGL